MSIFKHSTNFPDSLYFWKTVIIFDPWPKLRTRSSGDVGSSEANVGGGGGVAVHPSGDMGAVVAL